MEACLAEPLPCEPTFALVPVFDDERRPPRRKADGDAVPRRRKKVGNRVVIVGRMRELALYRAEVLRQAGFIALIPEDSDAAVGIMRKRNFDAIVLSYTLSSDVVERLTSFAREYCPDCPVIAIAGNFTEDRRIVPDAVVLADDGPPALISALRKVLQAN